MLRHSCRTVAAGIAVCLLLMITEARAQQPSRPSTVDYLQQRVRQQPQNASYWRMLGRAYGNAGDHGQAVEALERAIELDPHSAAAHCDLGCALLTLSQNTGDASLSNLQQRAARHFQLAADLAPDSDYSRIAAERLQELPPLPSVQAASFEIDRFERSDRFPDLSIESALDEPVDTLRPLSARIETGALYNTNVTLTPTSRGLAAGEAASFQGVLNTDMEYLLLNGEFWRVGPSLDTYFNMNEGPFQDLNLQSYQPGFFAERSIYLDTTILVPRFHYTYTLDEFAGNTFANRHALHTTVSSLWDAGQTTTAYWTIDYTNFADNGAVPSITSRDGWTNTIGAHQIWPLGGRWWNTFLVGSEVQIADTDGSDFAYRGVSVYSESEILLSDTISMTVEGGWGFRDYHRFEFTPARDENIWSGGVRLRKTINNSWSLMGVFRFDDFDSNNADFASQRYVTGLVTVFEY